MQNLRNLLQKKDINESDIINAVLNIISQKQSNYDHKEPNKTQNGTNLETIHKKVDKYLPSLNSTLGHKLDNFTSIDMKNIFFVLPDLLKLPKLIPKQSVKKTDISPLAVKEKLYPLIEERKRLLKKLEENEKSILNLGQSQQTKEIISTDAELNVVIDTYHDVLNILSLSYLYLRTNESEKYSQKDVIEYSEPLIGEIGSILSSRKKELLEQENKKLLIKVWRIREFVSFYGESGKILFGEQRFEEILPQNLAKREVVRKKKEVVKPEVIKLDEVVVEKKKEKKEKVVEVIKIRSGGSSGRGWGKSVRSTKGKTLKEIQEEERVSKGLEPDQLLGFS